MIDATPHLTAVTVVLSGIFTEVVNHVSSRTFGPVRPLITVTVPTQSSDEALLSDYIALSDK